MNKLVPIANIGCNDHGIAFAESVSTEIDNSRLHTDIRAYVLIKKVVLDRSRHSLNSSERKGTFRTSYKLHSLTIRTDELGRGKNVSIQVLCEYAGNPVQMLGS